MLITKLINWLWNKKKNYRLTCTFALKMEKSSKPINKLARLKKFDAKIYKYTLPHFLDISKENVKFNVNQTLT